MTTKRKKDFFRGAFTLLVGVLWVIMGLSPLILRNADAPFIELATMILSTIASALWFTYWFEHLPEPEYRKRLTDEQSEIWLELRGQIWRSFFQAIAISMVAIAFHIAHPTTEELIATKLTGLTIFGIGVVWGIKKNITGAKLATPLLVLVFTTLTLDSTTGCISAITLYSGWIFANMHRIANPSQNPLPKP